MTEEQLSKAKTALWDEMSAIITKMLPDVTESVKSSIKEEFTKFFKAGLEAEKKTKQHANLHRGSWLHGIT